MLAGKYVPAAVVADLGASHIRFASVSAGEDHSTAPQLTNIQRYQCAEFDSLASAIKHYLSCWSEQTGSRRSVLCLAIPGPVHSNPVQLTNIPWQVDVRQLEAQFQCAVQLLNDLSAQALAIPCFEDNELGWLRPPDTTTAVGKDRGIVAVGTGLGVAGLIGDSRTIESEGGHSHFTAMNESHVTLLKNLWPHFPRVSWERLLSGPGLVNLFHAMHSTEPCVEDPAIITRRALQGDRHCCSTIAEFSRLLGSFCGDLALNLGAVGGIYLSGGVLAHLGELFDEQEFLAQFDDKGRFNEYCHAIPVARVMHAYPGLLGAARYHLIQNQARSGP